MSREKIYESVGELDRVTRVTDPVAGVGSVVRKKLLAMRTEIKKESPLDPVVETHNPNLPPVVVETLTLTACMPWCPQCGSWLVRERTWSNHDVTIDCVVCRAAIQGGPIVKPADPVRHKLEFVECGCKLDFAPGRFCNRGE